MKYYALTLGCVVCLSMPAFAQWYEGGTLHLATVEQWQSGSAADQLATSADWSVALIGQSQALQIGMDGIRDRAEDLSSCVTTASSDAPSNSAANQLAIACAQLMGW
jgi:hypothetical protein